MTTATKEFAVRTAQVNGARLAYELSGTGELLMMIRGSNLATGLLSLAAPLARHERGLRLLRCHRVDMASPRQDPPRSGSTPPTRWPCSTVWACRPPCLRLFLLPVTRPY